LGGLAGFSLYPTCACCVFVGGAVPQLRDLSAATHQQKHQQPLRWGVASIPAAPAAWAFARQGGPATPETRAFARQGGPAAACAKAAAML